MPRTYGEFVDSQTLLKRAKMLRLLSERMEALSAAIREAPAPHAKFQGDVNARTSPELLRRWLVSGIKWAQREYAERVDLDGILDGIDEPFLTAKAEAEPLSGRVRKKN